MFLISLFSFNTVAWDKIRSRNCTWHPIACKHRHNDRNTRQREAMPANRSHMRNKSRYLPCVSIFYWLNNHSKNNRYIRLQNCSCLDGYQTLE